MKFDRTQKNDIQSNQPAAYASIGEHSQKFTLLARIDDVPCFLCFLMFIKKLGLTYSFHNIKMNGHLLMCTL